MSEKEGARISPLGFVPVGSHLVSVPGMDCVDPLATGTAVPFDERAPNLGSLDTIEGLVDAVSSISINVSHGAVGDVETFIRA